MTELTRRAALAGVGGAGVFVLAGCVSSDDPENTEAPDNEMNTDSGTDEMTLTASIERVDSRCAMSESGEASVFLADGEFTVTGEIPASNPCHDPELTAHSFSDGTLSVTVDVVARADEPCASCTGTVYYEARLSGPTPDDVERVSVSHADGQTYETPASDIRQGPPAVRGATMAESTSEPRGSSDRGRADVTLPETDSRTGTVTIEGAIPTEHPHYEAVLEEATVHGKTLRVGVGVESTLEDGRMGTMPLGIIEYTAHVDVEYPDGLESVTVEHPNSGYGSSWGSNSASAGDSSGSHDS